MRTIAAGEFKAKCLAIMDEVQASGEPVLVTKRGKPVVRISAPDSEGFSQTSDSIFDSLRHLGRITGDIVSSEFTDDEWERMEEERWARVEGKFSE